MKKKLQRPKADLVQIDPNLYPRLKACGSLENLKYADPLELEEAERALAQKEIDRENKQRKEASRRGHL